VAAQRSIIKNQIIKSPLWLLGFVDGEGCFYLKITRKKKTNIIIFFNNSTLSRQRFI
jgi:hypothetical protein